MTDLAVTGGTTNPVAVILVVIVIIVVGAGVLWSIARQIRRK